MIAVADSSPLIVLAKLGCFDLLNRVFPRVYVSNEVHREIVVAGAGLPGASEVREANWIEVKHLQDPTRIRSAESHGLGPGEMSTILLAKELRRCPALLDDYKARKLAKVEGLEVMGSVGLLETFFARGHLADLRSMFRQLIEHNVYVDTRLLDRRLRSMNLPPL